MLVSEFKDQREENEVVEHSEAQAIEWIHAFLTEIERIDNFFISKRDELIDEFILLQDKFRIKTDAHMREQEKERLDNEAKEAKK